MRGLNRPAKNLKCLSQGKLGHMPDKRRDAPRRKSVPRSRNFQLGMKVGGGQYAAAKKVKQYEEDLNCD